MPSRAVVVSTASDLLYNYWKEINQPWLSKIDKLYCVKGRPADPYPQNVEKILKKAKEDTFLIMHDDLFVYNPGIINQYFTIAEQGMVATPLHKSYNNMDKVEDAMLFVYERIACFIPCFLFISRKNLRKTSIDLSGDKHCELGNVEFAGDQGIRMVLELLKEDIEFYWIEKEVGPKPDWVHAQGLSYHFLDRQGLSLDANKLAWAIELLGLDPLEVACKARRNSEYKISEHNHG